MTPKLCLAAGLAVGLIACDQPVMPLPASAPSSQSPAPPSPPVTSARPPIVPGVEPPGGTYQFDTAVNVRPYTQQSRFVLGDDGRFALQYDCCEYRGTYTYSQATGIITFEWEGWSIAGPWGATGSLTGDLLSVSFNLVMQLSDFEDAKYRRVP